MTTREQAIAMMEAHNAEIDAYMNGPLAEALGCEDGKTTINLEKWFLAQSLIRQQNFYEKGMKILNQLRAEGYDVKINGQSDKLCGLGVKDY